MSETTTYQVRPSGQRWSVMHEVGPRTMFVARCRDQAVAERIARLLTEDDERQERKAQECGEFQSAAVLKAAYRQALTQEPHP